LALEGTPPFQSLKENISEPSNPRKKFLASAFDGDSFVEKVSRRISCALVPDVSSASCKMVWMGIDSSI
jgi:hypothetical protein